MNVLIIHAHPEPCSFNGAMTRTAVRTLTRLNHEVRVSDLYAMGWNAVLQAEDFSERVDGHFF